MLPPRTTQTHYLFVRVEMNLRALTATLFVALAVSATAAVDHDKVEPFPQPEPVTASEKAAIKFKTQLYTPENVCVPYPAVNAAGEVTGGLKGTNGNDACKYAPKGSQVYGRAGWYKDVWAIMYVWYFPKGFWWSFPTRRHDWKSVVVWIDNPGLETSKIVGVAMSQIRQETDLSSPYLIFGDWGGDYQDLIMWEQLTDAARVALNDSNNFGEADIPFRDEPY
ncbi:hypothetical protein PHYPSEUDO_015196 [Phytophthora pseudosyringae]|uniref:Necrosis inducing-like protein NPP1 type n=1 Tax=Phytophthora pseudosyringae TaxID=221518 RepID=A0A8T1V6A5_9STRA|nr:hypothetical protein PHYPSEUDO_015196 [Phytophthora pseudosyringae]